MYSTSGRQGAEAEATVLKQGVEQGGFKAEKQEWSHTKKLQDYLISWVLETAPSSSVMFVGILAHGRLGTIRGADESEIPVNQVMESITEHIPEYLPLVSTIYFDEE